MIDVAVPFFLLHYAGLGRILAAARGFFETLIPVYTSEVDESPLTLAVSAVATRLFSLWCHGDAVQVEQHVKAHNRAVVSLRSALQHPESHRRASVTLAVLALHLHESMSAVYDARQAKPVHHHGALSLLSIAALDGLDDMVSKHVKSYVLHAEISSALRQKRAMLPHAYRFVNSSSTLALIPGNFSSTLDSIGVFVSELQADYMHNSGREVFGLPLAQQCMAWIAEADRLDGSLLSWARYMPDRWRPLKLKHGQEFNLSIPAYRYTCEVYPSCQIATLWNLWRLYRLLLLKITIEATQQISASTADELLGDEHVLPNATESILRPDDIQELVDSICYSIPFYLGNRTKELNLSDFSDSEMLFPSFHSLTPGDPRITVRHDGYTDIALSKDEHDRHVIAYGAWQITGPLSNLITLLSDDDGGRLMASYLRPRQQDWIRAQFVRLGTILRLPEAHPSGVDEIDSKLLSSKDPRSAGGAVECLARQVRRGAIFMSGS